MNNAKTTSVALALTAALGASAAAVHAGTNPFGVTALEGGYMLLADAGDKTKAEGKCGGDKKTAEGKCGGDKKTAEGKCGGDKKAAEGKCGGSK